jgi:hypothetical protein
MTMKKTPKEQPTEKKKPSLKVESEEQRKAPAEPINDLRWR